MAEPTSGRPLQLIVILAGAALGLWMATGVTLTLTMGRARPSLALAVWPWGTTALATRAAQEADGPAPDAAHRARARADAHRALRSEPGNIAALRTLGLVAAMEQRSDAIKYFSAAERFSRRDLVVQLALIEREVARGSVEAVVTHYDRALRTGYRAYDLLFPILVSASVDPAIALPLGHRLATRPAWWNAFVERAILNPAPNPMLGWLVRQARLRADRPNERPMLVAAMTRLLAQGDIAGARLLYSDVRGATMAGAMLRDGGFERADQLPPFEWELIDTADLAAVREPGEQAGTTRLRLVANGGHDGLLARQLLVLAFGRYRLTLAAGDAQARGFALQITCAGKERQPLADLTIAPPASGQPRLTTDFTVPADCSSQWLTVIARNTSEEGAVGLTSPWIDQLAITRSSTSSSQRSETVR